MKKLIALFLALTLSLSLAACGGQPAGQSDSASAESADVPDASSLPEEEAEASAAGADSEIAGYYLSKADEVEITDTHVIVTDDGAGEKLEIAKNPRKVAVLFSSLASLWYEAGGTVQLGIGGKSAAATYEEQIGRDITRDEGFTTVAESPSASSWDIETILAGKPDLIICSTGLKGYATISGPAEAAGIPVIGINYDSVQDYLKWFKVFCNLNGRPELWDEVADRTASEIVEIVSKVPETEKAPTALILAISSGALRAYSLDSQPGIILHELGGINVADPNAEGLPAVDIDTEEIYALDPDMIFLTGSSDVTMDTLLEMQKENPVWDSLRAVKEGRLYFLEKSLFHNKANRLYSESYRTMAGFLYPDTAF